MALMQNARMRFLAIIAIDLTMAASSLVFAVSLRVSGALEPAVVPGLWVAAPLFALIAFGVFNTIGIYRRMWRYTSLEIGSGSGRERGCSKCKDVGSPYN